MTVFGIENICILHADAIIFCNHTKNAPIAGSIQISITQNTAMIKKNNINKKNFSLICE